MADNENQKPQAETEPKKPGIRTMVSDVQELAKSKKFSLGDLVASRQRRKIEYEEEGGFEKARPYIYLSAIILALILVGSGVFWTARKIQNVSQEQESLNPPPSVIPASRQQIIEVGSADGRALAGAWKELFRLQLLPREFLYVPVFDRDRNEFLGALDFFGLAQASLPPLFSNSIGGRSSFGVTDTFRGNEPIFIIEITNFSSAFAGLLEWEERMPADLKDLLNPELSYDRGGNVFLDTVVANNDARFLQNRLGEYVLGYSIFNRRFLILAQSPQVMEIAIKQMSALPPR